MNAYVQNMTTETFANAIKVDDFLKAENQEEGGLAYT